VLNFPISLNYYQQRLCAKILMTVPDKARHPALLCQAIERQAPQKQPQLLAREEIARLFACCAHPVYRMALITLYASACGSPCDQARQLLNERGAPFSNKDPQASPEAQAELKKLTGQLKVPVLIVGSDKIDGFESGQWHAALDRAGYPKSVLPGRKPMPAATPAPASPSSPAQTPTPATTK